MSKHYPGWWDDVTWPDIYYDEGLCVTWAYNALIKHAVFSGGVVETKHKSGTLTIPPVEVMALASEMGGRCVFKSDIHGMYVWPDAFVQINHYSTHIVSCNKELFDKLQKLVEHYKPEQSNTKVEVITYNGHAYDTDELVMEPVPLEVDNYAADVITAHAHIVEDLKATSPCGRIILLDGPPGSGKTFIVRSLLKTVEHGRTILIPAQLVDQLNGPLFMRLLIGKREGISGPMLLVIEDADSIVATRMSENMSALSTFLNLSDGIIGGVLDLRILATTNSKKTDYDPAVVRPGRLCRHVHVGRLSAEEGQRVFKRLCPESSRPITIPYTLAEVYQIAREFGWRPKP